MFPIVRLLVHLGLQSLAAHKNKSLIVGGLMAMGAFVVVVALALLSNVQDATRQSIVQSVSGDLQVYKKDARDQLSLFGGMGFGSDDIGQIDDLQPVAEAVRAVDNVATVVPMGLAVASVGSPGDLDRALNSLRDVVRRGTAGVIDDEQKALIERIRSIAALLHDQQQRQSEVSNVALGETMPILDRAVSDELWNGYAADPLAVLDWLDVNLAPLGEQGNQFFLRLLGTDLPLFRQSFPRLKILDGQMVPDGERGVLVGKAFLDRRVKMPIALTLDTIRDERASGSTIAGNRTLAEGVARMQRQATRILTLLPPRDVAVVESALRKAVPDAPAGDLPGLVRSFLTVTDDNFDARYQLFYDVIAPKIQLYPFRVGDTITLTAFTKSGYVKSVNVKVWGIYAVDGLESSDLASSLSLTDLHTFRDLYGARTKESQAELEAMRRNVAARQVSRDDAEAALFGGDDAGAVATVQETGNASAAATIAAKDVVNDALQLGGGGAVGATFDEAEMKKGLALSLAVLVKDPTRVHATRKAVDAVVAPMGLQVVDWQQATGVIGQMTMVVSGVLLAAIAILFLVTIVILNNSLVMATLERVSEFGTLRAIGAQKSFVRAMVVFETAVLGALAGLVGTIIGALFIAWLHKVGVPAPNRLLEVMFGGPRMYPALGLMPVLAGLLATVVVGVAATLYPANLATRVQPVVAMQGKE